MHYHAEVWVKDLATLKESLEAAMEPHREGDSDGGFWDWYQLGGRYTGSHDGYVPEQDPRNLETCRQCDGTGFRSDQLGRETRERDPSYTCNGCGTCSYETGKWEHGPYGAGRSLKWTTRWAKHTGDIVPVDQVSADLTAWTLIVGDKVLHAESYDGSRPPKERFVAGPMKGRKVKDVLAELGVTSGYLVTVDYHS